MDILNCDPVEEICPLTFLNMEDDEQLELTVTAIFGTCLAEFRCMEILDSKFRSRVNQKVVKNLLLIIQKVLEAILKIEKYCWLVHNGTCNFILISI